MKKLLLIALVAFVAVACSETEEESQGRVDISSVQPIDTVYICTGSGSKRFHANDGCAGIVGCTKVIKPVTRAGAEKRKRTFCHICFRDSIE